MLCQVEQHTGRRLAGADFMHFRRSLTSWRKRVAPILNLVLFGAAVYVIDRVMREYHPREVADAITRIPTVGIVASVLVTEAGYLALVGYDFVAFRFLGRHLKLRTVLLPSFISFAVSNSAPASVFTAGGLRYQLYKPMGVTADEATVVAGFNVVTYLLGLFTIAGLMLLVSPMRSLPGRSAGILMLLAAGAYLLMARYRPGVMRVGRVHLRIPPSRCALWQLGVSLADWILSSGALYILLLALTPVSYVDFTSTFILAQFGTLLLPIPGGVGVFEAVMLIMRPSGTPASYTLGALLLYRVIYYLLPLLVAGILLGVRWLAAVRKSGDPARQVREQLAAFSPTLIAWTTFLAGMLLLVSGVVPPSDRRLAWLGTVLPLGLIEATHLLGSIVGALLVVLAWGIELRSRIAYRIVCVLFGVGILLSAVRSLDYAVALTLAAGLVVLIAARRFFPRTTSILRTPMASGWMFAIGAVLIGLIWVAVILYRHADLGGQVWWRFALFGGAPRALRASVAAAVLILIFGLVRVLGGRETAGRHRATDGSARDA